MSDDSFPPRQQPDASDPPPSGFQPTGGYQPAPAYRSGYEPAYGARPVPAGYYFHEPSGLTLPVGTELASVGRRIGAYFLAVPLSIVTLVIGYLIWGLAIWSKGKSPALSVLGMRVYDPATGRVATFGKMALRNIIGYIVDGILSIITLLISFIMFLTGNQRQALHDKVGATVVLYDPNKVLPQ